MINRVTSLKVAASVLLAAVVVTILLVAIKRDPGTTQDTAQPSITPSSTSEVRFAVVGDSYTGGSDYGGYPPNGWSSLVLNDLQASGKPAVADISGQGGSGYVRRGQQGTVFGEEAAKTVTGADRLVVFFGSVNDAEVPPDQLAAAVNDAYDVAKTNAPRAALLVIGPVWPRGDAPPPLLGVRDVLAAATSAHGGVFVDPIAEGWLQGRPELIGADGIHPTNAGHQVLAQLIEPHVAQLLNPTQ